MPKVLIVVEAEVAEMASPTTLGMVSALKAAIASSSKQPVSVQVIAASTLTASNQWEASWESKDLIFCPLTLNLPPVSFASQEIIQACKDVAGLRQNLAQLKVAIGDGCFWLPVVLTAKGPLYGEVIALTTEVVGEKLPENLSLCDLSYYQPFHLSDAWRQRLYQMARQLLQCLSAPPATYLVQFGLQNSQICFDRLWPFPAAPALASLGVQKPDLFTCHWHCLTGLPIIDLTIIPPVD